LKNTNKKLIQVSSGVRIAAVLSLKFSSIKAATTNVKLAAELPIAAVTSQSLLKKESPGVFHLTLPETATNSKPATELTGKFAKAIYLTLKPCLAPTAGTLGAIGCTNTITISVTPLSII
jgi:hypothetical protein